MTDRTSLILMMTLCAPLLLTVAHAQQDDETELAAGRRVIAPGEPGHSVSSDDEAAQPRDMTTLRNVKRINRSQLRGRLAPEAPALAGDPLPDLTSPPLSAPRIRPGNRLWRPSQSEQLIMSNRRGLRAQTGSPSRTEETFPDGSLRPKITPMSPAHRPNTPADPARPQQAPQLIQPELQPVPGTASGAQRPLSLAEGIDDSASNLVSAPEQAEPGLTDLELATLMDKTSEVISPAEPSAPVGKSPRGFSENRAVIESQPTEPVSVLRPQTGRVRVNRLPSPQPADEAGVEDDTLIEDEEEEIAGEPTLAEPLPPQSEPELEHEPVSGPITMSETVDRRTAPEAPEDFLLSESPVVIVLASDDQESVEPLRKNSSDDAPESAAGVGAKVFARRSLMQASAEVTDGNSTGKVNGLNRPIRSISLVDPVDLNGTRPDNLAQKETEHLPIYQLSGNPFVDVAGSRDHYCFQCNPLYFEDPDLERCGLSYGFCQPTASAIRFIGQTLFLPVQMMSACPGDCETMLGDCRTGQSLEH